jgi:hypothetical protein
MTTMICKWANQVCEQPNHHGCQDAGCPRSGPGVAVPAASGRTGPAVGGPHPVPTDPLWMRVIGYLSTADWWAIGTAAVVGVVGGVLVGAWWR